MPVVTANQNAQFEQIDQEILRYEEAVRELKSRRNLLAPISRLPAEILCAVFMFCSVPEPLTPASFGSVDTRWRWIIVTHTSRLWRSIALSCPALWSKPEFTKTEWAYEMIRRSKMAPLTIQVSSNYWLTPRVVDAVSEGLKHLSRISEINLAASRDNMDKLLSSINHPAPFLRTLFLDIGRSDYYYHSRSEPYILPEDFLSGDAPRLSHIELVRCHLRWDSPLLANLSYLKVNHPGPPAPTLDQLISALAGMPQLEILDLENTLPTSTNTESIQKPEVGLPRLRKLRAVGALDECAIFFDHVSVPSSATIHVVARCFESPSQTLGLVNAMSQRLPVARDSGQNVPAIKSLMVQSVGIGTGIVVEAWNSSSNSKNKSSVVIPSSERAVTLNTFASPTSIGWLKLEFSWQATVKKQLHDDVVVAVCDPLPLAQLRTLHVRNWYHESVDSPTFAKMFGSLPKVNTLTVEGNSAYGFVNALSQARIPDGMSSSSPSRPALPFPALRTLKLLDADFDCDRDGENTLLPPLMDCLMQRYELKAEIHKLVLERCTHLTSDDVVDLEEIVADVEWDGMECGYSESEDDDMDEDFDDDMEYGGMGAYYGYGTAAYFDSDDDMAYMDY
jgi:hypothetical protein